MSFEGKLNYDDFSISGWNKCGLNNGGCSHLCLAKPANQRSCACPTTYTLMSNNRDCAGTKEE